MNHYCYTEFHWAESDDGTWLLIAQGYELQARTEQRNELRLNRIHVDTGVLRYASPEYRSGKHLNCFALFAKRQ